MTKPLYAMALIVVFAVSGCEDRPSNNTKAITACIELGGVPVFGDSNVHAIKDCKFPPSVKSEASE